VFVQLDQRQSNPKVVPRTKRSDGAKIIELDGGGLGLGKGTREECCPSKGGVYSLGVVPRPLSIRVGGRLKVSARGKRLNGGVTPANPHDS